MKILEYIGLDVSRHRPAYEKARSAIENDDFRSADVKKLVNITHGKFYRAKLDYSNRLLFSIIRHGADTYALMLELIENHAYDKSRFLRGAVIDEDKLPDIEPIQAIGDADPIHYVHPHRREIHVLDKVISFDDTQEAVFQLQPPLIIVGSAGSGKTMLTLEKLKHVAGEVLYVTLSTYLAKSAQNTYYSNGFGKKGQNTTFYSYREFLESIRVPKGREASWREFHGWFIRVKQQFKGIEAHQAFEEIRGVLTAGVGGALSRDGYLKLGVRQSIYRQEQRVLVYDLFEKYREWLTEYGFYDINLVSHESLAVATPFYDFVVVDEVQDLTNAQLSLILKSLKNPSQFLLCGDSNQIVHPNFFSWSNVKSLLWNESKLSDHQELQVLRTNFRNSSQTTQVANNLLKIKHKRFGSIDFESTFLVESASSTTGQVTLLEDKESVKKDLNQKTIGSTQVAVLVLRDEDKAEARKCFRTPLLFSIHEAKGLEYENIILYRFISDRRSEFTEITEGVTAQDIQVEGLDYARAKDKTDKSLEIYKFYVNSLYVGLTRAIKNVYLLESDTGHRLLDLLNLRSENDSIKVTVRTSTLDEWRKEARKLALQGKQEQAEAIRKTVLKEVPVPWAVCDENWLRDSLTKVFVDKVSGSKVKAPLYEYAKFYNESTLAMYLEHVVDFKPAKNYANEPISCRDKHLMQFYSPNTKAVLHLCDLHGIDHRTNMNLTPLMAASIAGNASLVEALLERGADSTLTDHFGRTALHLAMLNAFCVPQYATNKFSAIYELLAPSSFDLKIGGRLVPIKQHDAQYFLVLTLCALFKFQFANPAHYAHESWWQMDRDSSGSTTYEQLCDTVGSDTAASFTTNMILRAWENIPASIVKPERNTKQHIDRVFKLNEMTSKHAQTRRLFKRIKPGHYRFNPDISLRRPGTGDDGWTPLLEALNLQLIKQLASNCYWQYIDAMLAAANMQPSNVLSALEQWNLSAPKPTAEDILDSCSFGRLAELIAWEKMGYLPVLTERRVAKCIEVLIESSTINYYASLSALQWFLTKSGYSTQCLSPSNQYADIDALTSFAAGFGRLDILKWLAFEFTPISSNLREEDFFTVLYAAVAEGRLDVVKWYMTDLAAALHVNPENGRLLYCAVLAGQLDIIKWLQFDSGLTVNLNTDKVSNARPIAMAAGTGHLELVRWLVLDSGQAVNVTLDQNAALAAARKAGHKDIVAFLETVITVQNQYGLDAVPLKMKELEAEKLLIPPLS